MCRGREGREKEDGEGEEEGKRVARVKGTYDGREQRREWGWCGVQEGRGGR